MMDSVSDWDNNMRSGHAVTDCIRTKLGRLGSFGGREGRGRPLVVPDSGS